MTAKFLWFSPSPPSKITKVFLLGGDGYLLDMGVKPYQSMGCHPSLTEDTPSGLLIMETLVYLQAMILRLCKASLRQNFQTET